MADASVDLTRLCDEAAIRDLIARFADTAIRADYDGFRELFAEDAVIEVGPPANARAVGPDDITTWMRGLREAKTFFVQYALPGPIEIDGYEARVRTVINETATGDGGVYYRNHAIMFDEMRKVEGRWLFARRRNEFLWLDTSPFSGDTFRFPSSAQR